MRSGLTSSKISTNHWRSLVLGCAATGGVAAIGLPLAAQSPAIVPADFNANQAAIAPLPKLPAMVPAKTAENFSTAEKPAPIPAPATKSVSQAQKEMMKVSLEFHKVPVTELLAMIAMQGDVAITIGADVDTTIIIPYIKWNDVTPEKAIQNAAQAAFLSWKKLDDATFFIGKNLPPNLVEEQPKPRSIQPRPNPLDPAPSSGEGIWANFGSMRPPQQAGTPFEALMPMGNNHRSAREEREIRPIRVRNVRPGILAYWINPRNQRVPHEFEYAEAGMKNHLSPHLLKSAVDPQVWSQLNSRGSSAAPVLPFASPYIPNAYANPYANSYANPYAGAGVAQGQQALQPNYRTNFQFGGGFGGGGGGFGGGQGQGQGQGQGGFGFGGGVLELPEGVDQLVAIDSQNVLLVYGTAEGVARLQTIIEYLDRPIRQVEIEAQFIDVSVNDARAFGIQFFNRNSLRRQQDEDADDEDADNIDLNRTSGGIGAGIGGANQLVISYGDYQAQVSFLTQSGRARIINSPRITTMNNLSASLQSQQITPIILTSSTEGIGGQVGQEQQAFFLTTSIGIQVTPTINNDDTITVFMTPFVQTQVPTPSLVQGGQTGGGDDDEDGDGGSSVPNIPTVLAQSLTTVANVKDNDVIVLGGLRTRTESVVRSRIPILSRIPIIGKLFQSTNRSDVDRELIIFLTARIHRRTNDVTPIQGP